MAEIVITEDGIYFNHRVGVSRATLAHTKTPEDVSALYEKVKTYVPELDLTVEEFNYFLDQAAASSTF